MALRIGLIPLARATFDVPFAQETADRAFAALEAAGFELVGARGLLFDAPAADAAMQRLSSERIDLLLLLQVTFTDAVVTVDLSRAAEVPLAIWAFPEPRVGGRLRLNSFCGLNLAAHALGRADRKFRWLYSAPDAPDIAASLRALARGDAAQVVSVPAVAPLPEDRAAASEILSGLSGARIGLIGGHPAGFDTCRYDPAAMEALAGVGVQAFPVGALFARAKTQAAIPGVTDHWREEISAITGLDALNQEELRKSLSIAAALDEMKDDHSLSAFAVRCWPEIFTEYGCAACGPMGFLTEAGIPCACEADVYGAMTLMLLNAVSEESSWLVDIVDMDARSDTGVFWHCGSAPMSMADPEFALRAQVHSNRKMALLQEFPLKPGRITIARVSQARNQTKMILAGADVLRAPISFTGTSGVVRFDRKAGAVAAAMMEETLEHHVAICYGEHRPMLRAVAEAMKIPVVELT